MDGLRAAILSCRSDQLTSQERALFTKMPPCGFILFERHCRDPHRLGRLIAQLRDCAPHALIMMDQEGGRVQRLKPPHWQQLPAAADMGRLYEEGHKQDAINNLARTVQTIARDCHAVGIDMVTAPVLDVPQTDADNIIGSRAFSADCATVCALGKQWIMTAKQSGLLWVMKHAIGHGRARVDSHKSLPIVDASKEELRGSDMIPFKSLAHHEHGWLMTAHIRYDAFDCHQPVTYSSLIVKEVIRQEIGFGGVIITDDLAMGALDGMDMEERALAAREAGHDVVLYCGDDVSSMAAVCEGAGVVADDSAHLMAQTIARRDASLAS